MKTILVRAIMAPLVVLGIAGCASPSSTVESRRAKIPEFALSPALTAPDAYHTPDAKWSSDVQSTILKYTGGGLIPALVGSAVDKHILNEQQARFDESQAAALPAINERASRPPAAVVENAVRSAARANGFLATKIRDQAKCVLEIKIVRFGLAKRNKEEDADPMMVAQILVDLTIRAGDTTFIHLGGFSGASNKALRMSTLAKNPEVIADLYRAAADSLRDLLTTIFQTKYDQS